MINLINDDMFNYLPKIEKNSIDLIIADLPYGQTSCEWDNKINLDKLWIELKRISKDNTCYLFFCNTKFGYELIKSNEKWFRYDIVWDKYVTCGFLNSKRQPLRQHEMIYIFYKKLPLYNIIDNHKININNDYEIIDNNKVIKAGSIYGVSNKKIDNTYEPKLPTSILTIKKIQKCSSGNSTEKPIELFEWIIRYYSNKQSKILDICFGSGNSALACQNLNRNYIGIEINKIFYDNCFKKISNNKETK